MVMRWTVIIMDMNADNLATREKKGERVDVG